MSALVTIDFSQVEARGLLWLAGDEINLQPYREGADPYLRLAAQTFGVDAGELRAAYDAGDPSAKAKRTIGKVQVLALGYGGGVGALSAFASSSGVDLAAAGLSAAAIVEAYRDAHPLVAGRRTGSSVRVEREGEEPYHVEVRRGGLWRDLYGALDAAAEHAAPCPADTTAAGGRVSFARDGRDVICYLPSGRPLRYRRVRRELRPDKFRPGEKRDVLVYDHAKGTRELYPGIVAENVTQAVCRDLLARALRRLEAAGFPVVLHVHDEVVVEIDAAPDSAEARQALADVISIVSMPPQWAGGFPVAADGDVGSRWSK